MIDNCFFNCTPMGNYTLEIGQLEKRGFKIFDFDYPFYDEKHRSDFEKKFLLHFRYHEIGQETLQRFKYMLQDTLTIEHEKYLHFYNAKMKAQDLQWWNNKDYHTSTVRILDSTDNSTTSNDSVNTSKSDVQSVVNNSTGNTSKFLDTPQGRIENMESYLTNATIDAGTDKTNSTDTSEGTSKNNTKGNSTKVGKDVESIRSDEYGNIGITTAGSLVKSWLQDAYINVDKMIFNDCEKLFMMVY